MRSCVKPLLLINPNTNAATTEEMARIARYAAPPALVVEGVTARRGAALIHDEELLAISASAVVELAGTLDLARYCGIIVAAFGDPGLDRLREFSPVPVTGIAEAGIMEAAGKGRRFSVVTITPDLVAAIRKRVEAYGYGDRFTGVRLTQGDAVSAMGDPGRLEESLAEACALAISEDKAEAIIIGGGPLARHAAALAPRFDVPIIEPVPAAIRLALARAESRPPG